MELATLVQDIHRLNHEYELFIISTFNPTSGIIAFLPPN